MKFLKKNISAIVAVVVFVLVVSGLLFFKEVFTADDATAIYGSRLEGREKIEITTERINQVKTAVKDSSKNTSVRIAGRIILIIISCC